MILGAVDIFPLLPIHCTALQQLVLKRERGGGGARFHG